MIVLKAKFSTEDGVLYKTDKGLHLYDKSHALAASVGHGKSEYIVLRTSDLRSGWVAELEGHDRTFWYPTAEEALLALCADVIEKAARTSAVATKACQLRAKLPSYITRDRRLATHQKRNRSRPCGQHDQKETP